MAGTKQQRTVTATVVGHEPHNGKPVTQLDVHEWRPLKYPFALYGTTPEQQVLLPKGKTFRVILECGQQKKDTDGSKPVDFFWDFVGIADEPIPEPEPTPVVRSQGEQIHRSVALQQAVIWWGHAGAVPAEICETADVFYAWLIGGTE